MRKSIRLLPLFFLATACGSIPDDPQEASIRVPVRSTGSHAEVLAHTQNHDEASLLKAAAAILASGGSLGSSAAESCWKREMHRPSVREACALAWSASPESSDFLRASLLPEATRSRVLAIAVLKKQGLVRTLSFELLISVLSVLGEEPAWLRARAITDWLESRPEKPGPVERRHLLTSVGAAELAEPGSARAYYELARVLGAGGQEELLLSYCRPAATGLAQVRCWRFLSSLVDPRTGEGLDAQAAQYLPKRREIGWSLFERSFPERAILLKRYL